MLKLLEDTYQSFINNGANLNVEQKEVYRDLSKKLAGTVAIRSKRIEELNDYSLLITDAKVLEGMPADFMEMAAEKAEKAGKKGWLLDLRYTSYSPIMTYMPTTVICAVKFGWLTTLSRLAGSKYDNTELIKDIVNLRLQIANLFGFSTYADYVLRFRMAENSKNVYKLLNDLLIAYKPYGDKESWRQCRNMPLKIMLILPFQSVGFQLL